MSVRVLLPAAWREPLEVLGAFADEPFALAFLSDGSALGRWSYLALRPAAVFDGLPALRAALARDLAPADPDPHHPPFQGGAAGLASYEWGAALEPSVPQDRSAWPDLIGGLYHTLLAFDHHRRQVWAVGWGTTRGDAVALAESALALLGCNGPPSAPFRALSFTPSQSGADHERAVAAVVAATERGEIFQANIARAWTGRLDPQASPFDLLTALLRASPAPFAGYLRLAERAVVSNSPEQFLSVSPLGRVRTRPIKGTRPRGRTPEEDAALAAELEASAKDRAENLMIVDLMRNDLARVSQPGSVTVQTFCALESYTNVHHLVTTIAAQLSPGVGALDLFASAFPPGSVTGAPKVQSMKVIARHEAPRGPYCGSLFWIGADGAMDSNVLIRTLALEQDAAGWRFETRAGGGVTVASVPAEEDAEAEAKIAAIRRVLGR